MLDEKELEQIVVIVKRTQDKEEEPGCFMVIALAVVLMLAIFGFICLLIIFKD